MSQKDDYDDAWANYGRRNNIEWGRWFLVGIILLMFGAVAIFMLFGCVAV